MSETEVVLFAQGLSQLKALEKLSFKVIQYISLSDSQVQLHFRYPNVSEGCIYYLMSTFLSSRISSSLRSILEGTPSLFKNKLLNL